MIYVSKIGETIRYPATRVWDDGRFMDVKERTEACRPCIALAKKEYPTATAEPVRCFHVAVQGTVR